MAGLFHCILKVSPTGGDLEGAGGRLNNPPVGISRLKTPAQKYCG